MKTEQAAAGCYDPAYEHDACGVAFVADLRRPASHRVVSLGLTDLRQRGEAQAEDHRRMQTDSFGCHL